MKNLVKKKFLYKFLIINLIFCIFSIIGFGIFNHTSSHAATYTYTSNSNDLPEDFESLYPGYISLIQQVQELHPTWTIKLLETNLNWEEVINNEYLGHGGSPKNLIPANDVRYSNEWICEICGNQTYDSSNWVCASRKTIEYMMDPRNFINENDIFQFQDLSYQSPNEEKDWVAVTEMIKGTFLDGDLPGETLAENVNSIILAAKTNNVSPYHIVSRIIQEQGKNGSTLGLGIQDGEFKYYNLFNIGATGQNSEAEVIANGLQTAKNKGWTSMEKAIIEGSAFLANNYISVGQNTLYFQKFNVVYHAALYRHQYMQNVFAPLNEGKIMRQEYIENGFLESNYTFIIPLYKNMPADKSAQPSNQIVYEQEGELATINASSLALRDGIGLGSNTMCYVASGTTVLITERAEQKIDGYYWDKVITPLGTGYMARAAADDSKQYLIVIGQNIIDALDKYSLPDEAGNIYVEENVLVSMLKQAYPDAQILKTDGTVANDVDLVGTGTKIVISELTQYTIIKLGDANGDGRIDTGDTFLIKKIIMEVSSPNEIEKSSLDINKDGIIDTGDSFLLKKHVMEVSKIKI